MISREEKMSQRKQCLCLDLPRSSVYVEPKGENVANLEYMTLIDKEHIERPWKGVLSMRDHLRGLGHWVGEKRVRRLMRLMDIRAIYPQKNLSKLGKAKYIRPYLLRGLSIDRVNQVWAIDITYIPMKKGFMYLTAVIDLYSRYIVGWSLSNSLDARSQTELIERLTENGAKPEIINSDQGSQYTSREWTNLISDLEIQISMDGKGRATDNAFIERFFRTIKREYIYLQPADTVSELRTGIEKYITYYNDQRTHQGIQSKIPQELYIQKEVKSVSNNFNTTANSVEMKDPICRVEILKTTAVLNKYQSKIGL